MELGWTAPGDDGSEGRAAAYEVRWSEEELDEGSWEGGTEVGPLPPPREAGSRERAVMGGLQPGRSVWLGVRALDGAGNRSGVSNGVEVEVMGRCRVWRVEADGSGDAPTVLALRVPAA